MKHMERYLAATSAKSRDKEIKSDHSAADSHDAVLAPSASCNAEQVAAQLSPKSSKPKVLEVTSRSVAGRQSMTSFFRGAKESPCDMSIYDEVTVAEQTVAETVVEEEIIEEEVLEEEEIIEEDEDYAWDGSAHTNSQRSRLSQRFPSRSFRSPMDSSASTRSSAMYDEETVATDAYELEHSGHSRMSKMSFYDEETVADQTVAETVSEEVTVVEGTLDDFADEDDDDDDSDGHNSDLDSDDGMEDEEEGEGEECEGQGFTLAFQRDSGQARVSDISMDHSSWAQEMEDEFADDDHLMPGPVDEGYCSQFKAGNFRSSLVSLAAPTKKFPVHKIGAPVNAFVPSNKFAAPPKAMPMKTSTFVPKRPPANKFVPFNKFAAPPTATTMPTSTFLPKMTSPRSPKSPKSLIPKSKPRISIMQQFANKPLPALTEVSARKERGGKKKKPAKSFDGAGQKKQLFLFWERISTAGPTPKAAESKSESPVEPPPVPAAP
ncbi:MAG: hypothetical protein SGBAC_004463 [Bacillariaceae sp.]